MYNDKRPSKCSKICITPKEDVKLRTCERCKKVFAYRSGLTRHYRNGCVIRKPGRKKKIMYDFPDLKNITKIKFLEYRIGRLESLLLEQDLELDRIKGFMEDE